MGASCWWACVGQEQDDAEWVMQEESCCSRGRHSLSGWKPSVCHRVPESGTHTAAALDWTEKLSDYKLTFIKHNQHFILLFLGRFLFKM